MYEYNTFPDYAIPDSQQSLPPETGCIGSMPRSNPHSPLPSFLFPLFTFLFSLFIFASCRTKTVIVEVQDSTSTHVHTHTVFVPDTILVPLPPQTVMVTTPDTISHIETDYAASDAAILGGLLHHYLTTKPTPVPVPVSHKETTRDSIVYRERKVPVPVVQEVEKPLTRWQQARLHLANIMLILLGICTAVWLVRKRTWWLRLLRK